MNRHSALTIVGTGIMLLVGQGFSDTIAKDPFQLGAEAYATGSSLSGQGPVGSPVVGFTGSWSGDALPEPVATGLSPDYASASGGAVEFDLSGADDSLRSVGRDFTEQINAASRIVYWSGLVYMDAADTNADAYVTWTDDANTTAFRVRFGIIGGTLKVVLATTTADLGTFTPGTAHHIVVRATINIGAPGSEWKDNIRVWVDPTLDDLLSLSNMQYASEAISCVNDTSGFDHVSITTANAAGRVVRFDELVHTTRIGDFMPIPGTLAFDPFPVGVGAYTNAAELRYQGPTNSPIIGFTGAWSGNTSLAKLDSTSLASPKVTESGGSVVFNMVGYNDYARYAARSFTDLGLPAGTTVYWGGIIQMDAEDADADAYIDWRDSASSSGYYRMQFGIIDGRLTVVLGTTNAVLDIGAFTPGKAQHIVVKATINEPGPNVDAMSAWINPTYDDVLNGTNTATNRDDISFIVSNSGFDLVTLRTDAMANRIAIFDELVHTTDIDDLHLSPAPPPQSMLILR